MAHSQCSDPLIKAIVDEHNRYRTQPKAVAAELEAMKQKLIDSRTRGVSNPDSVKTTEDAVNTAIVDLDALTPLPALRCDYGASAAALQAADTRNGQHSSFTAIEADWRANRASSRPIAESIARLANEASDTERARTLLRDLFCDWGDANAAHYPHRMFIISYRSRTVMEKDPAWLTPRQKTDKLSIVGVGIKANLVYLQYGM